MEIEAGCAGQENRFSGDYGLRKYLAYAGSSGRIEVSPVFHMPPNLAFFGWQRDDLRNFPLVSFVIVTIHSNHIRFF